MKAEQINILLIGESPEVHSIVKTATDSPEIINLSTFTLKTAANPLEAIDLINYQYFDVIVLDLDFTGSGEVNSFEKVHQLDTGAAIVILSGPGNEQMAVNFARSGAQDFLNRDNITSAVLVPDLLLAIERKHILEQFKKREYKEI